MARRSLASRSSEEESFPMFQSFQREMNQLLDRFRSPLAPSNSEAFSAFTGPAFPAMDIAQTDGALEITAEMPGVKEEDLDVSINGDVLILKGEKSAEREEKEADYQLVERRYGSFRRQIPLGFVPEDGSVDAKFADGVLKLTIAQPKDAASQVQKVTIKKD